MNHPGNTSRRGRRVHRSADQWAELIEAQARSGLSITAFCVEHDLSPNSFHRWRGRLTGPTGRRPAADGFVRLRMGDGEARPGDSTRSEVWDRDTIVVRFVDGVEVHVADRHLDAVLTQLRAGARAGGAG